jgi:hypothetical protein
MGRVVERLQVILGCCIPQILMTSTYDGWPGVIAILEGGGAGARRRLQVNLMVLSPLKSHLIPPVTADLHAAICAAVTASLLPACRCNPGSLLFSHLCYRYPLRCAGNCLLACDQVCSCYKPACC